VRDGAVSVLCDLSRTARSADEPLHHYIAGLLAAGDDVSLVGAGLVLTHAANALHGYRVALLRGDAAIAAAYRSDLKIPTSAVAHFLEDSSLHPVLAPLPVDERQVVALDALRLFGELPPPRRWASTHRHSRIVRSWAQVRIVAHCVRTGAHDVLALPFSIRLSGAAAIVWGGVTYHWCLLARGRRLARRAVLATTVTSAVISSHAGQADHRADTPPSLVTEASHPTVANGSSIAWRQTPLSTARTATATTPTPPGALDRISVSDLRCR
jgi:hypothetical protein